MTTKNDDDSGNDRRGYRSGGRLVGIPDPSELTTDQLRREIGALREVLEQRIIGQDRYIATLAETINHRQQSIDAAAMSLNIVLTTEIKKLESVNNEIFKRVETQLNDRLAVISEVFRKVDVQFIERDKQASQLALSNSTAIAAAMQAAEKAVGAQNISNSTAIAKSEAATAESLKQLRELFLSESKATNDKVDDIKTRLDKGEGKSSIADPATWSEISHLRAAVTTLTADDKLAQGRGKGLSDGWGYLVGIGGIVVAIAALFLKGHL